MEHVIEKLKALGWVIMTIFTVSCFIQTLIQLSPRVTELERRAAITEGKVSMIEVKLDTVLHQTTETPDNDIRGKELAPFSDVSVVADTGDKVYFKGSAVPVNVFIEDAE